MQTPSTDQRRLLGAFLRTHRERLSPQTAGLAAGLAVGARRRTPGLRREEAAQLAGVSATWYTWLEQGRDVSASPQALARVAESLQLTHAERAYLFEVAGRRDPAAPAAAADAPPGLAEAISRFDGPAYGLDRCWNAVCWNPAAERLFEGWLAGAERNLVRWVFRDAGARRLIVDWPDRARRVLAEFRADFSRSLSDPQMGRLVETLRGEDETFAAFWDEQAVLAREGGTRRFDHPWEGPLAFEQFTFQPADRPDCKLVLLAPRSADAR